MRPFELVLVLALAVWLFARARGRGRGIGDAFAPLRWAPAALVTLALIAQVSLEGVRWNLTGIYVVAIVVVAVDLAKSLRRGDLGPSEARSEPPPGAVAGRTWMAGIAVLGLGVATLPAILLPVPRLPAPTGTWSVGTASIEYLVPVPVAAEDGDAAAPSPDGTDNDDAAAPQAPIRARARLWYPAPTGARAVSGGDLAGTRAWLEHVDVMLPALGTRAGLPGWALGHLAATKVHAVWDLPVAGDGPLGVVTFDHGRGGFAAQNTFLAEELASHGWLVVAPEHPGGAVLSVFRDGSHVPFDPASFGEGLEGEAYDATIRALGLRWAGESAAALDALEAGAGPAGLVGRVDRSRLVTTGHSTGGGSAFALCRREPGCRAVVGLDPWMLPVPEALTRPAEEVDVADEVVGLFSDFELGFFEPSNLAAFERLAAAVEATGDRARYEVYLDAGHMDFADVGLLSPIADRLGLYVGPASPRDVLPRIRSDVLGVLADVE